MPLLVALWVQGCATAPPPGRVEMELSHFRPFVVPEPLLPFWAEGSVQFTFRERRESGRLILEGFPGPAYRIRLRARLTGGLALEARFDPNTLLVVDYLNETYYLGANTPANRRHLFLVDLTPGEFLTVFTGRIGAGPFRSGGGTLSGGEATYLAGNAQHSFLLDGHGLPSEWIRRRSGEPELRVVFREYMTVEGAPWLRVPRKVRLTQDGGQTALALGLQRFVPGATAGKMPPVTKLPESAREYAPSPLPDALPASPMGGW